MQEPVYVLHVVRNEISLAFRVLSTAFMAKRRNERQRERVSGEGKYGKEL